MSNGIIEVNEVIEEISSSPLLSSAREATLSVRDETEGV